MDLQKPDNIRISMIAAMAQNHVIGDGEKMPWHIPEDLKLFRRYTSGKPVIMGRKTYESIGRPLPKRINIVVTRDENWPAPEGVTVARDLQTALDEAAAAAHAQHGEEVIIMGGGTIYQQFLPAADRIYLTRIMKDFKGSAHFPDWPQEEWTKTHSEKLETEALYDFEILFEQHDRI